MIFNLEKKSHFSQKRPAEIHLPFKRAKAKVNLHRNLNVASSPSQNVRIEFLGYSPGNDNNANWIPSNNYSPNLISPISSCFVSREKAERSKKNKKKKSDG